MDNYSKIKLMLEHGFKVKCQLEDKDYVIFSSIRSDGGLRMSDAEPDISECIDTLGNNWEEEHIINDTKYYKFLSITPIIEKPKMYEVGDLVDIAEEAKEIGSYIGWVKEQKEMVGQQGFKIKEKNNSAKGIYYKVYGKNKKEAHRFPAWCLTPHIPQKEDKPSIDDVIAKLEDLFTCSSGERRLISEAIEMLKKLK